MKVTTWNIEQLTGYKPISTFYEDLSTADWFGRDAIQDTYNRVVREWSCDCEMFTEFVMALNWKIWEWADKDNDIAALYDRLWQQADQIAMEKFKDEELTYYLRTTD